MSNLDCVDRLREEIARASDAQAQKLNLSLKLLAHARGQNEDRGRDILKGMIITADVFSRVMRETLSSTQRDEIVREVTLAYSFPKKDMRIIRAIVDYWLSQLASESASRTKSQSA
jgi:hypothetical protein